MSEEWKWGWEAIGAIGTGVVTAFGVYAALSSNNSSRLT